jgi:hypothetical protein
VLLGTLTSVVFCIGSSVFLLNGVPQRIGGGAIIAAAEASNMNPKSKMCLLHEGVDTSGCSFGDEKLPLDAIVLGDSHAMALMSAVYESNPKDQKHMLFLGYSACPTIRDVKMKNKGDGYACSEFINKVINEINTTYAGIPLIIINRSSVYLHNQSNPDRVKFAGPLIYFDQPIDSLSEQFIEEYRARFTATLCELSKDRHTYIVESIPEMGRHVPKYMEKQFLLADFQDEIVIQLDEHLRRSNLSNGVIRETASLCGTHPLDPLPYLCNEKQCIGSENGRPLYYDGDHLSEYGNKRLIPMFETIWDVDRAL